MNVLVKYSVCNLVPNPFFKGKALGTRLTSSLNFVCIYKSETNVLQNTRVATCLVTRRLMDEDVHNPRAKRGAWERIELS